MYLILRAMMGTKKEFESNKREESVLLFLLRDSKQHHASHFQKRLNVEFVMQATKGPFLFFKTLKATEKKTFQRKGDHYITTVAFFKGFLGEPSQSWHGLQKFRVACADSPVPVGGVTGIPEARPRTRTAPPAW